MEWILQCFFTFWIEFFKSVYVLLLSMLQQKSTNMQNAKEYNKINQERKGTQVGLQNLSMRTRRIETESQRTGERG